MHVLICGVFILANATAYVLGYMHGKDAHDRKAEARVIRPANITIEKKVNVTEYTVSDKALDIDFPSVRRSET